MKRDLSRLLTLWIVVLAFATSVTHSAPPIAQNSCKFYFPDNARGTCRAVSVTTECDLVHTAQILPLDKNCVIVANASTADQVRQVMANLAAVLEQAHSGLGQIVKLNVYVRDESISPEVTRWLASHYSGNAKPAVTFVAMRLAVADALIAVDAVAVVANGPANARFGAAARCAPSSGSAFAILPSGRRVYISGQAEKGDKTLGDATTKTLESLVTSLKYCGLTRDNIVQLKAFMNPMTDAAAVSKSVAAFFHDGSAPPLILVEWKAGGLPIEIELVASSPGVSKDAGPIEYLTPPELKKSPLYSRIVRLSAPRVIYVGGVTAGKPGQAAVDEVGALFPQLRETLQTAGSDLEHMAKATYYVADSEVSGALNKIRPNYYNPDRPPAASKAEVIGTGVAGNKITIDMIAVPTMNHER